MDYVGLFCLGIFVGSIAAVGLKFMTDPANWKQGMTAMILATLSGSSVLFVDRFRSSEAIGTYPMGLLIALIWAYAPVALDNIGSQSRQMRALGWLHLVAVVLATLLSAALIFPYAWTAATTAIGHSTAR
jgi:hypothetical protein